MEVASLSRRWQLFIYEFPKRWFHFTFTWSPDGSLKLYFNGQLELEQDSSKSEELERADENSKKKEMKMYLARYDAQKLTEEYGKFDIGHLAIWSKTLLPDEVQKVYDASVVLSNSAELCCSKIISESLKIHL